MSGDASRSVSLPNSVPSKAPGGGSRRSPFPVALWALETMTGSQPVGEGCHPLKVCHRTRQGPVLVTAVPPAAFFARFQLSVLTGTNHRFSPTLSNPPHRTSLACAISRCHPVLAVSDSHVSRELLRAVTPPPSRSSHRIRLPWLPRFQPREIPKPVTYPARSFIELPITTLWVATA